jgi:hypothetical protein
MDVMTTLIARSLQQLSCTVTDNLIHVTKSETTLYVVTKRVPLLNSTFR